jgi:Vitamin K epoxide reductase family
MPRKRVLATANASTPPSWSYNPSSWSERLPLVGLALAGFAIAISLTYFQVGIIHALWDPFFGSASSARVSSSPVSRLLPIPDASLGALGYAADAILGSIGGPDRWRRMPWMVLLFSLAIPGVGHRQHSVTHYAGRRRPGMVHALPLLRCHLDSDPRDGHRRGAGGAATPQAPPARGGRCGGLCWG